MDRAVTFGDLVIILAVYLTAQVLFELALKAADAWRMLRDLELDPETDGGTASSAIVADDGPEGCVPTVPPSPVMRTPAHPGRPPGRGR